MTSVRSISCLVKGHIMKKFIALLSGLLISVSSAMATPTSNELIAIDDFKAQKESAFELYGQSNFEEALPAIEQIAKIGDKKAQYIVGVMYLNAQGTEQDLMKSYAWLTVANEQRNKQWARPLALLNEKLPVDYLTLAKEEADKYVSLYGKKAQKVKCRNVKTLGSKKPTHQCKKSEVKDGYYYVANPTYLVSN